MKKRIPQSQMYLGLFALALLAAMLFTMLPQQTGSGQARGVDHGDYITMPSQATEQPEVTIFFSYACSHCYNAHQELSEATARLPGKASVNWVQVPFFPRDGKTAERMMQAAAIGAHLDQQHALNQAVFNAYHVSREIQQPQDVNRVVSQWLTAQGNKAGFDELAATEEVQQLVEQMRELSERSSIMAVPAVTVNGQYQLKLQSVSSVNEMRALISRLLRL